MSRSSTVPGVIPLDPARTRDTISVPARPLRRVAGWISALLADDGMSGRFAAERRRDEGLVRRVQGRRYL